MSGNKLVILMIATTLLLIGGGAYLLGKTSQPELKVSGEVKTEVTETSFDWGEIPINGGNVSHDFIIANSGPGALKLASVATSCMCTTAKVTIGDSQSPFFSMHSNSTWTGEVEPKGEARLTVEFDPAYHGPSGLGAITRQVVVETNDGNLPQLTFNLTANVVN
ncbi:MAG: hypothetical protein UX85_C0010G0009 [Candidatus Beckwithbacteria bacterium GW2011_GWB1_47_15]|uniref:DUF1573 domain-containing protein n=1 Tax=Candidatus Beckwithbacteria bacterium GW2011_GWB1_47_15 TaxID=1618371 RepID=A0A0G1RTQ6_9BACT|nr:MAG: Uncharacterized protein UY43_C0001G0813 [Candidatus Beckwithbacteria bacterium GW2011_GWC1_49_16]AQS30950.1 hypothetical protein [uncultured bacterium]KKU34882.1 MAG: hypothetical protein UX50_C0009G0009 [Candidatus Beckwithbacteria bacterium GW2011_GWA1_46_30]KKU60476.1 MAG: hypothetical protein UX85_C0010G0009 [Candidatus Beckwithbacteria bacterium GW2011_GWB1_47_15]KKU72351.1 MAG: hypothetical protein UX97_C0001G0221 [Candidatus Beckwithbacteria bacterium GW2011_GWA2_47_25]OGD48243.